MTDSSDVSTVDAANDDLLSSKYVRLNDGSRRRSGALVNDQEETRKKGSSHMNGKARNATINAVPQDAHLRHYQEHLEERRLKNKRMREGKLVTMLRKKAAVVKKDASTQVTPADLGLDDWDEEEEDEEDEEDDDEDTCVMNEFTDFYGTYPRPASAAPDPGPWQDVSSSSQESYNQWYYQNWAGYSGKTSEGPPQLTQEQTYRYVYYYYNYYAALETQDGDSSTAAGTSAEHYNDNLHSQQHQHQQQQYMSMNSNQQASWPNNTSNRQGSASSNKRQMRGLFDEWRRKYEEWYMTTFGQPVNAIPNQENTAMAAHRAQMETARLNALKQQQEMHLERPGRPNSLLPAPPLGHETSESLLPPPPPPSAPPPETPAPPPPPETPRPETPAAQAAAAAAAAHVLGANVSTPADVAAAIAQLSNSDLAAILSSVNRAARAATPSTSGSSATTSSASTINLLAAATPSLLSLPPLPVIGVPNPLAAPIFPPPMPAALRREALAAAAAATAATATSSTSASSISLVPTSPVLVLPTSLASSSAVTPPSASSSLTAVPQMMMMQPSFKFGPPFKPFGVFQGGTEDKWGPDAPLGRYGQRKEEEEKEAKSKMEVHRKRHLSGVNASPNSGDAENGDSEHGSSAPVSPAASLSDEEPHPSPLPSVEPQNENATETGLEKVSEMEPNLSEPSSNLSQSVSEIAEISGTQPEKEIEPEERRVEKSPEASLTVDNKPIDEEEEKKATSPVEHNMSEEQKVDTDMEVASNKDDSDSESTSSGGSVCSTATQSVAIGPRRTRTVASVCGGERIAKPARLAMPTNMSVSSIPVEKLTSLAESAAKRAVSDGIWYAPSQPLNSLRLPKQAMLHTLQSHIKAKVAELLARESDPRTQLTLSYAKALMDSVRHLLDMSVQFVVGSLCRLPSQRAKDFYGWDQLPSEVANSLKLCDVYIGDVFIAQGAAATTLGAKEAAARQSFKVLSRPGFVLGSTRLWMDTDHLVLCISEFPLTVPILPPFLLDPCSPAILHGPQPPSEFGTPGPDGDGGLETEVGGEVEDEEDWLLQSVAINPKPLEHLWLYEPYDELSVSAALRRAAGCREARLARRTDRQRRGTQHRIQESQPEEEGQQASRRSVRGISLGDDLHEAALADMSTLSLAPEADQEALEDAVVGDEPDLSGVEINEEALAILSRSCDFSHMLLSVEVEVSRYATFTCCVFIDRQFCACATDQPSLMKARQLAATRALALLRQSQPAVGLDAPELSPAAVVDSLMWRARYETMRPVHSLLSAYGMTHFEWERIFMYYAESASIEPFFISTHDLEIHKWPEVKKEAEKWGLLVKESRVPGASTNAPPDTAQCLFVCKRMPLATVKRRLMRYGACGHFLLLRRGVYPTSEDEEQSDDVESEEEDSEEQTLNAPGAGTELDEAPEPIVTMGEVKEEPDELEEQRLDDLIFLGGSTTTFTDCEILDDLPKTRIPGFDY